MQNLIALVVATTIMLAVPALGARYCASDSDCSDIGELKCIFSMCPSKGICGCERNMVAKWMGTSMLFQCVPLRKLGQQCSNMNVTGACGAPNSFCNETKGKGKGKKGEWHGFCQCLANNLPEHGGESCTPMANVVNSNVMGETCHASGSCTGGGSCSATSNQLYNQVSGHQYTCACAKTQKLILAYSEATPFTDRLEPTCANRVIGDKCMADGDCAIGFSQCLTGTCQCDTGYTKNYYGNGCIDNTDKLAFGGNCTLLVHQQLCDGALGLVCGDECTWVTQTVRKCQCGRGHKTSGSSCVKIDIGEACVGDDNCNVYNNLAICVAGVCVDGAASIPTDFKTYDEENAAGAMYVTWSLLAAAIISRFL